uniref:Protein kinase domain-containing protein n=1 Tax=Oryza meridionalis TaxID=40149 RepID=A0A0E0CDH6_9ORYZ
MSFEVYKSVFYAKDSTRGECFVIDQRKLHLDLDGNPTKLHEATYIMGPSTIKCLVKNGTAEKPLMLKDYAILKNIRHPNIVSIQNFYDEAGEARFVISWVDGTLLAWIKSKKGQQGIIESSHISSRPSTTFRQIIIGISKALDCLLQHNIYPSEIRIEDVYVRVKGGITTVKLLVYEAQLATSRNTTASNQNAQRIKLWKDVKGVADKCVELAGLKKQIHPDCDRFLKYIGAGNVKWLEDYPDEWNDDKKSCYLKALVASDSKYVRSKLQLIGFTWPDYSDFLNNLITDQVTRLDIKYNILDPYDYLRLCRNLVKHWLSLPSNLREKNDDYAFFLRKMEKWTPRIWCNLYEAIGWPPNSNRF